MPTINVNRQGTATGAVSSNFNTARTSAAGSVNDGDTSSSIHVQYFHSASRGGLTKRFKRVFLHFDTSGITGTLSAAHIDVRGTSSSDPNDTIMIKSAAFGGDGGTALATSDFSLSLDYSTAYSTELTSWSTNNEYTLTAAALADIRNNNNFTLAIIEADSDYANSDQANISDISINLGVTITLDYTLTAGYGNSVNGVAAASISKINGIATASIEKVNGI